VFNSDTGEDVTAAFFAFIGISPGTGFVDNLNPGWRWLCCRHIKDYSRRWILLRQRPTLLTPL
jgi:hypothetical protein